MGTAKQITATCVTCLYIVVLIWLEWSWRYGWSFTPRDLFFLSLPFIPVLALVAVVWLANGIARTVALFLLLATIAIGVARILLDDEGVLIGLAIFGGWQSIALLVMGGAWFLSKRLARKATKPING
jgi:hypothetical protein